MSRQSASGKIQLLALAASALFALGAGSPDRLSLDVDGHAAGSAAYFLAGGVSFVEVDSVARAARVAVMRRGRALIVSVGGNSYLIRPGDRSITENGAVALRLASAPVLRANALYITVDDLSEVLGIGITLRGDDLALYLPSRNASTRIVEIPARVLPVVPQQMPSAPSRPETSTRRYGTVGLTISNSAGIQTHSVAATIDGQTIRANAFFDGLGTQSSLSGGLAIFGTDQHNVAIGDVGDPLNGIVFRSGAAYGGALVNDDGHHRYADVVRQNGGAVVAASRVADTYSDEVAFVGNGSGGYRPLFGARDLREWSAGEFAREAWIGSDGVATGVSLRTRGKAYVETDLDVAGAGLPLKPGDAPLRFAAGDRVTPGLDLQAGLFGGRGSSAGAFFDASCRLRNGAASASWQTGQTSFSLQLNGQTSSGLVAYYRYAGSSQLFGQANARGGVGTYELHTQVAGTTFADSYVQWSSRPREIGPIVGVEVLRSGSTNRAGLISGIRYALGPTTDVELSLHPLVYGDGVRVAISERIPLPERRGLGMTQVSMSGVPSTLPMKILLDGATVDAGRSGTFPLAVPPGSHYLSAISSDGTIGSPQVEVRGGATAVTLPLWPVRSIKGRVVIAAPLAIASSFSLQGAAVEETPGELVALVNADGTFSFDAAPVDPNAKIQVIASSLPGGLAPGPAAAISADGLTSVIAVPIAKVEKKSFPGG